jgi:hypothetical protein
MEELLWQLAYKKPSCCVWMYRIGHGIRESEIWGHFPPFGLGSELRPGNLTKFRGTASSREDVPENFPSSSPLNRVESGREAARVPLRRSNPRSRKTERARSFLPTERMLATDGAQVGPLLFSLPRLPLHGLPPPRAPLVVLCPWPSLSPPILTLVCAVGGRRRAQVNGGGGARRQLLDSRRSTWPLAGTPSG